jgi:dimethylsulfoniopropionate demethylase
LHSRSTGRAPVAAQLVEELDMAVISPSRRVRRTPFSDGVEAAGVKGYTVYNRMLLPTVFESVEADYHHLKRDVQVWDVACERQVQLQGPDAARLLQMLTPRNVARMGQDRCFYVPVVDQNGGMLNDPVALRAGEDTYWISIADSDLLLWAKGIAAANDLNVAVTEPDVSPLAVQGPKADALMARVFGEAVTNLRFFGMARFAFQDRNLIVARSGYSKQGGFEIYVEGSELGMPLWNALFEAGEDLNVRAGCPNLIERIEGGLLSYGNDMTDENSPLECGLRKFVDADVLDQCFGGRALREEMEVGSKRKICAVSIEGDLPPCDRAWPVLADGMQVGLITSSARSPDFGTNVAIAMLDRDYWNAGTRLEVQTQDGMARAQVEPKFWI